MPPIQPVNVGDIVEIEDEFLATIAEIGPDQVRLESEQFNGWISVSDLIPTIRNQ